MTVHATHEMHSNSLAAYAGLDGLPYRQREVLGCYISSLFAMSDREALERMGLNDMNAIRPRITELIKKELLEECRSAICHVTHRKVRVCRPTLKARSAL